jgi:hypothetical protein
MQNSKDGRMPDLIQYIGCCGAYCRTCRPFTKGFCKGCKLGYDKGTRVIDNARCKMKLCCFRERKFETCADCPDFDSCTIISGFFAKNGFKYKKYRQSLEFVRKNGYSEFIKSSDKWKGPYGKLD